MAETNPYTALAELKYVPWGDSSGSCLVILTTW